MIGGIGVYFQRHTLVVVAAGGVIVFFAAHRGREIAEHLIDNEAPEPAGHPRTDAVRPVSGA